MNAPLRFSPDTSHHGPRLRASAFHRNGVVVLRMTVPDGRCGEAEFPTMDEALAAVKPLHRQLTGEAA